MVRRVAERIVEATRSGLRIEATTDRHEALPGARFVVTTFAVGGAAAWDVDAHVGRYGLP